MENQASAMTSSRLSSFVVAHGLAVLLLFSANSCTGEKKSATRDGPLTPEQGRQSLQFSDDFEAVLFAAEPDIVDPVDIAFDESGRAFVTEMRDLPDDPPPGKPARGRIRLLEDTNGDGKADKATVYAENTMHASGLMPWDGGLIVPASPEILYFKDNDGDGKAEVREVWFTGFFHGNPEAQITNPRLGPDGWIYFSNNGAEGLVKSPKHPKHPAVQLRGFDFRYHPVRGVFEPVSGTAQYGMTMDDWGQRFISQNTVHLRHVALPRQYLARAPMLEVGTTMQDPYGDFPRRMYPLTEPQEWRVIRTKMRNQRYEELKTGRTEILAGFFTGATGSTIYSGDAWPEEYRGNIFTADVSGNLVRRDILSADGATYRARPAEVTEMKQKEFLASNDQWFRPTNFANGPDGNLYVTDMQREFIETPVSIPEELRKKMDFYSGDTIGRIYRIVSKRAKTQRGVRVELGKSTTAELVSLLGNSNGWHRDTAHRLLLERMDKAAAVPLLKQMALKGASAPGRLRALYLLSDHRALDAAAVAAALKDAQRDIREHAIRMAESFPALEKDILALTADPDPRVQFQLAFTLGNLKSPAARPALVNLAARYQSDRWTRTAILSSVANDPGVFFDQLQAKGALAKEMVGALSALVGSRKNPTEIKNLVASLARSSDPTAGLAGLARGLKLAGARGLKAPGMDGALTAYLDSGNEAAWEVARYFALPGLIDRATKTSQAEATPLKQRVLAVGALRGAAFAKAAPVLQAVLGSNPPPEVQSAAVLALSSFEDKGVAPALLAGWKGFSPEARAKVVGAMMAQKDRIPLLLDALENNQMEVNALETAARNRLLELSDATLLARAKKILANAGGDRAKVVADHNPVLSMTTNIPHGKQVFEDACARCHLPRKQGGRIGPDLSGINMKAKEELLTAILNPSEAIEQRFVNYVITTKDGRMYDGVLANETPGAVTLRGGSEEDVTVLRPQIQEMRASSISLMPEDIEKTLSKQDIADVIAYLRGGL
ncbi:MAG: c-type cytochrome [Acidobacteria bacterium]|nr:c-type cytochrome [Acidobacteriota bacterium]